MQIASWNINGIKARLEGLTRWLGEAQPDIVCLQETKCVDDAFPRLEIEALGYNVATHGQKGFNGVAILSKRPVEDVCYGLKGADDDVQTRFMEATVSTDAGAVRVAALYLPNGNPVDSDKFPYKLAFMDRLVAHAADLLAREEPIVIAGDYNIIPEPEDVRFPERWGEDALFRPESRARFRRLIGLGYTDALRAVDDSAGCYTFWDYQAGSWQKDWGLRIDHLLLSPQAADRLTSVRIDKTTRAWTKPSDHVPIVADLSL